MCAHLTLPQARVRIWTAIEDQPVAVAPPAGHWPSHARSLPADCSDPIECHECLASVLRSIVILICQAQNLVMDNVKAGGGAPPLPDSAARFGCQILAAQPEPSKPRVTVPR